MAGLVGCGAGFPLWLREVERRVAVVKAVVKLSLTWSAKGRAANQGIGRLGVGVATLGVVQSVSGLVGRWAVVPKAAVRCATLSVPLLFKVLSRRGLAKALLSPLGRCKMVPRLAGLGAGGVEAPWCVGQLAGVCLFRLWACAQPCVQRTRLRRGLAVGAGRAK